MRNSEDIAEILRLARQISRFTQEGVGYLLGSHRITISHFEAGRRNLLANQLPPLFGMFGVSVGWLFGETNPENPCRRQSEVGRARIAWPQRRAFGLIVECHPPFET